MNSGRLYKVEEKTTTDLIVDWFLAHPTFTFTLLFVVLAALLAIVFNLIWGMCTIESGVMRNYMNTSL